MQYRIKFGRAKATSTGNGIGGDYPDGRRYLFVGDLTKAFFHNFLSFNFSKFNKEIVKRR